MALFGGILLVRLRWIELIKNIEDARAAFDRFIEFEVQLRSEFEDHAPREIVLQLRAGVMQNGHIAVRFFVVTDDADVDVRVFQVRRRVDMLNRDKLRFELAFARDQVTELPPNQFIYACEAMLHG